MKIKAPVATLNDVLAILEPLTLKGNALMRAVLIEANAEGIVRMTTSGTSMQGARTFGSNVDEAGSACIDVRSLRAITQKLPKDKDVTLSATDGMLAVACARSRFKLPLLDPNEFPRWEAGQEGVTFDISASNLKDLLAPAQHAVCADDSRPNLTGICLINSAVEKGLHAVATDGHRLALRSLQDLELDVPAEGIIVPRETAREILRFTEKASVLKVTITDTRIEVNFEGNRIVSKLLAEKFPEYENLIPADGTAATVITLPLVEFAAALDRVMVVAGKTARVDFTIFPDAVELSTRDENEGGTETVDLEYQIDEEDLKKADQITKFAVNGRYLTEAIASFSSSLIDVHLNSNNQPIVIRPATVGQSEETINRSIELVMPMM